MEKKITIIAFLFVFAHSETIGQSIEGIKFKRKFKFGLNVLGSISNKLTGDNFINTKYSFGYGTQFALDYNWAPTWEINTGLGYSTQAFDCNFKDNSNNEAIYNIHLNAYSFSIPLTTCYSTKISRSNYLFFKGGVEAMYRLYYLRYPISNFVTLGTNSASSLTYPIILEIGFKTILSGTKTIRTSLLFEKDWVNSNLYTIQTSNLFYQLSICSAKVGFYF